MKLKILILSFLAVFLVAGSAMATPIVDGTFGLGEWSGYYAGGDGPLYPGGGGQEYDVEYLGLYITQDTVYFGLQTGFDVVDGRSINHYPDSFGPGDFALDTDGIAGYDTAIRFSGFDTTTPQAVSYALYSVSSWEDVYYMPDPTGYDHSEANPFAMATAGKLLGSFDGVWGEHNDSWVLEGSFARNLLTTPYNGDMTIHWTMECGNDYLNQTSTPVPEPATMLLLGTGLVCFAGFGRKRFLKRG